MKKILIALSATQLFSISVLIGQNFTFHSNSPFGIEIVREDTTRLAQTINFYDFDGDGDQDILLTGLDFIEDFDNWGQVHFFLEVQENIGTAEIPQFGERFELYEEFPYPLGYFFASPGDLNNDGQEDLIVGVEIDEIGNAKLKMFINTGVPGPGQFDVQSMDAMELPDFIPESLFKQELVDLDGDGDLDLMNSGFDPAFAVEDGPNIAQFYYARNVGTKAAPDFEGWYSSPYDLVPDTIGEFITHGDIDNDGDVDFIGSMIAIPADSMSLLLVHLNTPGPNGKPAFTTPLGSPFGLPTVFGESQFAFPELADIDGDGDLDLFVFLGDGQGQVLQYYENTLCTGVINNLSVTLCEGESIVVGGMSYSDAGDYTISLEGSNGCDSTIQLSITVDPIQTTILNESICEGEVILVGDEVFDATGDYMVFLVAMNGCDSVVFLSLVVNETYQTNLDESICDGASVHVGDEEFTVTGEYEVMLLSHAGCDSIVFLSLVVNENYSTNLNETICDGDVYSIGLEDFAQAGHYEVLLISQAGCDSLITLDLVVIEVDNSVAINESTLTASPSGVLFQWINCDSGENIQGATSQSYNVLETGNYAVNITDEFGCSAVSECVHVVITGIIEVALSKAIIIYPNPTDGWLNVMNATPYPISTLTVTNLAGQVMDEFILTETNRIDGSVLGQGMYFVKIQAGDFEIIKKLIVF